MKNIPSTKIDFNCNKIARIQDLDGLAKILFPGNRNHQKVFLAIYIELKYAPSEFMASLAPLCHQYNFSPRILETVRSKMRRMGLIDHVSRFNKRYGYREGCVFSGRFDGTIKRLGTIIDDFKAQKNSLKEKKDRDLFRYI